jgi:heme-degrading monooxygenase HmoA
MSTLQGDANQSDEEVERQVKLLRENILPSAGQLDGFRGVISMDDKHSGKAVTLTFWESEEAMRASEEAANRLREQAAEDMEESIAGVDRFEVYVHEPPQA